MLDLKNLEVPPRVWRTKTTKQYPFHLTPEANDLLQRAAEESGHSRSVVLHNLILHGLRAAEGPVATPEAQQKFAAQLVEKPVKAPKEGLAALVPDPNIDSFTGNKRAQLPLHADDTKRPRHVEDGDLGDDEEEIEL
jgi:uncharacterized protein (DUF1778 family)